MVLYSKKIKFKFFRRSFLPFGTRWRSWLRHCAKSRKVSGSIPVCVIGIFHWHNHSGRTLAMGLTQPHVSDPLNHIINQLHITSLKYAFLILSDQFRLDTKVDSYIQGLHISLWMYVSHQPRAFCFPHPSFVLDLTTLITLERARVGAVGWGTALQA